MSMTNSFIRTDHGDGIVGIALNQPPVNALSADFLMGFADLLDGLEGDSAVKAVVLSSPFKVFSAGIDLKKAIDFSPQDQHAMVHGLNVAFLKLFTFPKPVVTAVGGAAIAGGMFFVLASDFRVAGPRAKFGLAEVRVGVDFPVGPMEIARDTLSPNSLRRMMLTGQPIDATQALAEGIIDQIEPDQGILLDRALRTAREMSQSPAKAYGAVKHQIRAATVARIMTAMTKANKRPESDWFPDETRTAMKNMISGA